MSHGSEQDPRQPADILDAAATQGTEDARSAQGKPGVSPAFSRPDKPDPAEAKDHGPRQPAAVLDAAPAPGDAAPSSAQGQPGGSPAFPRPDMPGTGTQADDEDPRQPADVLDAAAAQGTDDASSTQGKPGVSPAFARPASKGAGKAAEAGGPQPSPATQSQHEPAPAPAAQQPRPGPSPAEAGPQASPAQAQPEAGQAGRLTEDSGGLAGEVADAAILGSTQGRQEIPDAATVAHTVPVKAGPLGSAGPSPKAREAGSGLAGQLQSTALHAAGQRPPPKHSAASAPADGGKAAQPKPESGTACPATCVRCRQCCGRATVQMDGATSQTGTGSATRACAVCCVARHSAVERGRLPSSCLARCPDAPPCKHGAHVACSCTRRRCPAGALEVAWPGAVGHTSLARCNMVLCTSWTTVAWLESRHSVIMHRALQAWLQPSTTLRPAGDELVGSAGASTQQAPPQQSAGPSGPALSSQAHKGSQTPAQQAARPASRATPAAAASAGVSGQAQRASASFVLAPAWLLRPGFTSTAHAVERGRDVAEARHPAHPRPSARPA